MKATLLPIASIERDMLLQPRATLHQDWIEEYAADMVAGAKMPPVTVFFDGTRYWLGDGFHRTHAAEAAGFESVLAEVRPGTRRDALLLSLSANADHGHRRTNDDKRRAVDIMLADPEWVRWSDRQIAEKCAVHHDTVSNRRRELSVGNRQLASRTVTRGGTTYEMQTGAIGNVVPPSALASVPPDANPSAAEPYDWEASRLRDNAMGAIRTLAGLPPPNEVIAAWMKSDSYGEPIATLEAASTWLADFARAYRVAEPRRWARVQSSREVSHAAE